MSYKSINNYFIYSIPTVLTLLSTVGVITYYTNKKIEPKIKTRLQHLNQYEQQGFTIANSHQIINKYNSIPNYINTDYTNKETVKSYMQKLQSALGNDIRIANHNFSTLRVEQEQCIRKTGACGTYNGTDNTIKYVKNDSYILGHEMIHMASYMYDPKLGIHYHGFMQQKGNTIICTGLNEGYTELLASRMFNKGRIGSYPRLVRIIKLLEEFFPNPQIVSHYYFTCNLPAFLHHLGKYCTQQEIKEIIHGLDQLYEYAFTPNHIKAITIETKLAAKIYNIYERNFVNDPAKIKSFRKKVGENKLSALAINNKKYKLTKQNPFTRIKNNIQRGFRKIKALFNTTPQTQTSYSK